MKRAGLVVRTAPILTLLALSACAAGGPPPEPADAAPDTCGAAAVQDLVGTHVGAVTFAPGANVRLVCTECAFTEDHRPDRMNVWFDQGSGLIRRVDCG